MIEIKNRIYNSKERKKQIRFNKYMTLKKTIRLKLKNVIPLNENEKTELKHFLNYKISQTIIKWLFFCQISILDIAYISRTSYNTIVRN